MRAGWAHGEHVCADAWENNVLFHQLICHRSLLFSALPSNELEPVVRILVRFNHRQCSEVFLERQVGKPIETWAPFDQ